MKRRRSFVACLRAMLGVRQLRTPSIRRLRRLMRVPPVMLAATQWNKRYVSELMRVDGVPAQLKLTYLLPNGSECVVVTQHRAIPPSFDVSLELFVWQIAGDAARTGVARAEILRTRGPAHAEAARAAEGEARRKWLSGETQQHTTLKLDGIDIPAIRIDRNGVTALGAQIGLTLVGVVGEPTTVEQVELVRQTGEA